MTYQNTIEKFINKYKLAVSSKSKDFRLTVEEAGELVQALATINSQKELSLNLFETKLDKFLEVLHKSMLVATPPQQEKPNVNGGSFK